MHRILDALSKKQPRVLRYILCHSLDKSLAEAVPVRGRVARPPRGPPMRLILDIDCKNVPSAGHTAEQRLPTVQHGILVGVLIIPQPL